MFFLRIRDILKVIEKKDILRFFLALTVVFTGRTIWILSAADLNKMKSAGTIGWQQDETGWWYRNADGSFYESGWHNGHSNRGSLHYDSVWNLSPSQFDIIEEFAIANISELFEEDGV